jgi:hypothetical protein
LKKNVTNILVTAVSPLKRSITNNIYRFRGKIFLGLQLSISQEFIFHFPVVYVGTVLSAKEDNKEEHFLEDGPVPLQPLYEGLHHRLW